MTTLRINAEPAPVRTVGECDRILRFRRSERLLHWAIAVPFMVCYATGMTLVLVYNPNPARPHHALFSWLHHISGLCLIVLPALTIALHWRELGLHARNIVCAWRWRHADVKWLLMIGPASLGSRVTLPDQEKFNAGEKINFMTLTATYPVYVVTGLMILLPGIAYTSWLVHVYTAAFIATPLMFGHIFMALVNSDTRPGLAGVLSGFVDREWARHHYRNWYDEACAEGPARGDPVAATEPVPADPGATDVPLVHVGQQRRPRLVAHGAAWLVGADDELLDGAMVAEPTGAES